MHHLIPAGTEGELSRDELLAQALAPAGKDAFVRFNMVSSVDGVAVLDGVSGGLGTPADRELFPLLRAVADAIVVGSGTVRAEGYAGELIDDSLRAWRVAHGRSERPRTVVLNPSASLDPQLEIFASAPEPILLIVGPDADPERVRALGAVAEVLPLPDVSPAAVTAALLARGLRHLHHEGGPGVLRAYLAAGVLDSLCLTLSPVLLAGRGAAGIDAHGDPVPARPMALHRLYEKDSTLLVEYRPARQEKAA